MWCLIQMASLIELQTSLGNLEELAVAVVSSTGAGDDELKVQATANNMRPRNKQSCQPREMLALCFVGYSSTSHGCCVYL